jgi:hypothetical protein
MRTGFTWTSTACFGLAQIEAAHTAQTDVATTGSGQSGFAWNSPAQTETARTNLLSPGSTQAARIQTGFAQACLVEPDVVRASLTGAGCTSTGLA